MPREDVSGTSDIRPQTRRWLVVAGLLHGIAMLLVMSALVQLTPLTMTFSVGGAGILLAAACGIYLVTVVLDLRQRRIL